METPHDHAAPARNGATHRAAVARRCPGSRPAPLGAYGFPLSSPIGAPSSGFVRLLLSTYSKA